MKWILLVTWAADYGWQLVVRIRCTIINQQELKDRHDDTIDYHEVTHDCIPVSCIILFNIKFCINLFLGKNKNVLMIKITASICMVVYYATVLNKV